MPQFLNSIEASMWVNLLFQNRQQCDCKDSKSLTGQNPFFPLAFRNRH